MAVFLCRHPFEEVGEEARAERADGMRRHLALQQPGQRVPIDASVELQQGVAFALVLRQERRSSPLASVHQAPHRRGPKIMENVGVLDKDKKKIQNHLTALQILKERGVKGLGIIGAYHTWRVAPLMSRVLPLLPGRGAHPPNVSTARQRRRKLLIHLFFSVFHSDSSLLFLLQRREMGQMGHFHSTGAQEDRRPSGKAGAAA